MPQTATAEIPSADEKLPVLVDRRLKSLPVAAVVKFEKLRRAEQRAMTTRDAISLERARIMEERNEALRQLGHFDRVNPNPTKIVEDEKTGGRKAVPFEPPERIELVGRVESAKHELERLAIEQQEASTGLDIDAILDCLARRPGQKFVAVPLPKFALNRGSSLEEMLEANRVECAALRDQIGLTSNAPLPSADAKRRMREEVEQIAERGRPEVANLLAGSGGVQWPSFQLIADGAGAHQYSVAATVPDALALAVWINKDAIIAALDEEIDIHSDDGAALSVEDRAARTRDLEAKLLELQRTGEAIAVKIEQFGRVARRHCFDPRVLLGIAEA
jgi:hypothetical protein